MDRQDIYNKVREHLLSMDRPAVVTTIVDGRMRVACRYLTVDGRKCAIGPFIPDGHPGQRCNGDVRLLLGDHRDLREVFGIETQQGFDPYHEDVSFLIALQQVHDEVGAHNLDTHWGPVGLNAKGRQALDEVAFDFGLTIPEDGRG